MPDHAISTGSAELDGILAGGYAPARVHLIEGRPGSGKTTLALQFLMAARDRGERTLYVTLSEGRDELLEAAATHGWDLDGIGIYELVPPEFSLDPGREQSIVYSSDLELGETVRLVMDEVERLAPTCVVFDSLSDIRLLAGTALRYRRQVLTLKHYFTLKGCTTLFIDDLTEEMDDANLHSLVHGVIRLEQITISYGAERRRLRVFKMRGRAFQGGFHDYVIRRGGLRIFPRLVAADHNDGFHNEDYVASGVAELDRMLGGGLDRGTSSLIMGPAGSGKSTLALQFVVAGLRRGERALFVSFDETRRNFHRRADGLGIDLVAFEDRFRFRQVDPAELSPGELIGLVRHNVEREGARIVVLDSLSGYQHAMPEEQHMMLQMHELLTYLNQQGVLTILVLAQHGLVGHMQTPVDLTYLSDTVLLLRFFEAGGQLRRAISITKKRTGGHEPSIREYRIDDGGIRVGLPLRAFTGVLTGVPTYNGRIEELLADRIGD
ncbi:Circadian clock protein KaiC [Rubellimicrobium mesophilum DSM 19309]|uniref:non-specific serine/threonine protein kinase n=1 Tax=Rubellimicrobium mesophilum DSM 19309 TaxID=442562 RepID=A0A017HL46_9RHOB|nr:ATPase domain-containing protein [Rubellimicrobium mesophilum]EYD75046.1 Circadian clock protein KaiC [Rubellimicrobium mesophilum DSM 19309]